MVDTASALLALRARAKTLVVATTGATSLSATANGYARAAGSFVTDGFWPGMELVPSGFGANSPAVIQSVTPTLITTVTTHAAESAASGRSLVVGLPLVRAWENITTTPIPNRPYITEEFSPGAHGMLGYPDNGSSNNEQGIYAITFYGLENYGSEGLRKSVDALRALFAPGTVLSAAGVPLRIKRNIAPVGGQVIPQGNGWAALQMQVTWWSLSTNTVAA